eukprot:TRINITY_DN1119_c0_g2_i1.p1 TRINITY_DN1119_c0_g2~~TRINITY_DN1119_c0_g2_i1.p1  ORF type:complete len:1182 (+),score=258.74 TRINITY_DN1119_c0_g2_i1:82-3627(+)
MLWRNAAAALLLVACTVVTAQNSGATSTPPCTGTHLSALIDGQMDKVGAGCLSCVVQSVAADNSGAYQCVADGTRCNAADQERWSEGERCRTSTNSTSEEELCIKGFARLLSSDCLACAARTALRPGRLCNFSPADIMSEMRFDSRVIVGCQAVVDMCHSPATPAPPPAPSAPSSQCTAADARHLMVTDIFNGTESEATPGCVTCLRLHPASCLAAPKTASCAAADMAMVMAANQCTDTSCREAFIQRLPDDCVTCFAAAVVQLFSSNASTDSGAGAQQMQVSLVQHLSACMAPTEDAVCDGVQIQKSIQMDVEGLEGACETCMLERFAHPGDLYKCIKPGMRCSAADAALWPQVQACKRQTGSVSRGECTTRFYSQFTPDCAGCVVRAAIAPGANCGFSAAAWLDDPLQDDSRVGDCQYVMTTCFAPGALPPPPPAGASPAPAPAGSGPCDGSATQNLLLGGAENYAMYDSSDAITGNVPEACYQCVLGRSMDSPETLYECINDTLRCNSHDEVIWSEGEDCEGMKNIQERDDCINWFGSRLSGDCVACMFNTALAPGEPCGFSAARAVSNEALAEDAIIIGCPRVKTRCLPHGGSLPPAPAVTIPESEQDSCDGEAVKAIVQDSLDRNRLGETCHACVMDGVVSPDEMYKCVKKDLQCSSQDGDVWSRGVGCELLVNNMEREDCLQWFLNKITGNCQACIMRVALSPGAPCKFTARAIVDDEGGAEGAIFIGCTAVQEQCHPKVLPPQELPHVRGQSCRGPQAKWLARDTLSEKDLGKDCMDCVTGMIGANHPEHVVQCIDPVPTCSSSDAQLWPEGLRCENITDAGMRRNCTEHFIDRLSGNCIACTLRTAMAPHEPCGPNVRSIVSDTRTVTDQVIFGCDKVKTMCLPAGKPGGAPATAAPLPATVEQSCGGDAAKQLFALEAPTLGASCSECWLSAPAADKYKCVAGGAMCNGQDAEQWRQAENCEDGNRPGAAESRRGGVAGMDVCVRDLTPKLSPDCAACMLRTILEPGAPCGMKPEDVFNDEVAAEKTFLKCQELQKRCRGFASTTAPAPPAPSPQGSGKAAGGSHSGMGAGTVLLLVLLIGLTLYCVGGAVWKIATGAESTFPQVLPHWDMWRRLPGRFGGRGRQGYFGVPGGETMDDALHETAFDDDNDIIDVIDDAPEVGHSPSMPRHEL